MNPNAPDNREKEIFGQALDLAGAERLEFVKRACGENAALCERVLALLKAHESDAEFLPEEPNDQATTLLPVTEKVGDKIGHYRLREKIGEGGCGIVYVAEQEEPVKRRVALKVIKLGMDTREVVARFEAERQALALMDHPNIARVFDGGATDTGRPYFVMELVRGVRITEFCDQHQLPTAERLKLFIQVCHAIQHAHQKGIIHRDIKPSNILVSLHDDVPVPKVIDFGIAKAVGERLTEKTLYTRFEQFIGTPAYMSPEQAGRSDLDIDTRTDIYALGVLLYELLTGSTPFDTQELLKVGLEEMLRTIREKEPVRPSTRIRQTASARGASRQSPLATPPSSLATDLDWIVMKCLEKNRTRRYETANGLALDIEAHLNHEVVMARPPSRAYRLAKFVRRNKVMVGAASAVTLTLVLGLAVSSWQMIAARHARNVAETERERADEQARKASQSREQSRRLLYASDMNLAQQALKLNNLGRARRLLDRHRPQAGEEDLRGWEWRYLWQLTRSSALVTLTNRPTRGYSVSFSPDGTRLAVGWWDGRVDLWDVPGRRWIRALTEREQHRQARVAFSPVRNLLAATSNPKVVTLYDLDSGRESVLWRSPDPGAQEVHDLAFSQDGSRVVIYAGATLVLSDKVWVVNASSSQIESSHSTLWSGNGSSFYGAAKLSPDNRCLYLARSDVFKNRYSIQCLDLATGKELWLTEGQRDRGLTALAISPDGRVLASGSGFGETTIFVWDAATGRRLVRLDGHTSWVCRLAFTKDGRRLISAGDQTIRFWDTSSWTETRVLRGHTDEVHAVAISESGQLVASAGKDGNLMLWSDDGKSAADGYRRLPENLRWNEVLPLDHSRVLLLPPGKPPELVDLKRDSPPVLLPGIESSADVLGWFGTNFLCHWNETNQIVVRELRGTEFIQRGAITLDFGKRPSGAAYSVSRQLLAWTEGTSSNSVYLASLTALGPRIELKSDVPGFVPIRFSEDGKYLAALRGNGVDFEDDSVRVWNVETRKLVASSDKRVYDSAFAAGGRVLVVAIQLGDDHEVRFYDLAHPDRPMQRVPGRHLPELLAVSPDGGLVALTTAGGLVRLFDPVKGEWIEDLHGHLNGATGIAFSVDGRRLISGSVGGLETVKLWDVGTRQELLTLSSPASFLYESPLARWSADGDVILAGQPWQAWSAPTWEEIAAAEAKSPTVTAP